MSATKSGPAVHSWQAADADALEVRADNIEAAIDSLVRIEGMYGSRPEIRDAIEATKGLLGTDATNIRSRVEKLRRES